MVRCTGSRDGVRCERRCLVVVPKGAPASTEPFTCSGCQSGQAPFVHRASERKGQQKQAKKK